MREHHDDVDSGQRAERAQHVGADAAEHRDHEVGTAVRGEVLEDDRELVVLVGADGREPVDHVVARIATGTEQLARAARDLDAALQPDESRHHRRGRFDCDLERLGVVMLWMDIERDRGARPPARLVLADHELVRARGRPPVDAAQVVTDFVLAQGQELVAEITRHRARRRDVALARHTAPDRDGRDDLVHAWPHEHLAVGHARHRAASEPERVARGEGERSDPVPPAPACRDPVRGARGGAGREGRHEEPRRASPLVEPVGHDEQRGGASPEVLDAEVDSPVGAHLEAVGADPALHRDVGHPPDREPPDHGHQERERRHAEHEHLDRPEEEAPDDEPDGGADERPTPPGERDLRGESHWSEPVRGQEPVAPGTATDARMPSTTSALVTPRNCASGASRTRCSTTAGKTRFTSSGITNVRE